MKKTPVDTNTDGKIDQAEDIVPFFTKNFFHFLREIEEQKLAEWVDEEERNKQLFNELTDEKEVQKNLAEIDNTEVNSALSRCLKKIKEEN
jgi:hypothetical protein